MLIQKLSFKSVSYITSQTWQATVCLNNKKRWDLCAHCQDEKNKKMYTSTEHFLRI